MARVLLYSSPAPGHIYPPIPTALALRDRGHQVAIRSGSGCVESLSRLGLDVAPIDPRIEAVPVEDWKARTPIGANRLLLDLFDQWARYEIPDLQAAIEAERPDLLWIDVNSSGAATAAAASGLPWGHYLPYPHPLPGRGLPPFGPGFAPATHAAARLRDAAADQLVKRSFNSALKGLNARRRALGLSPLDRFEEFVLTAPLLIEFSAEPFEYPRAWPENVRLVGPALWEPPGPEPEWLAAEERPILLVTASTEFQDDAALISTALEAFAGQPYLVVATCAAHDPGDFDAPANARVEQYLPHGPILRRAACVISHGGMGTTQKALAAGVPVCAVPFMRDQFEVARRVEHCGAGTRLPAKRLRPDRLRSAVEAAVGCRPGTERVRDAFERAGGPVAAAEALETLLPSERRAPAGESVS